METKQAQFEVRVENGATLIYDDEGIPVAKCFRDRYGVNAALAARMVKAVNAYPEMLALLEEVVSVRRAGMGAQLQNAIADLLAKLKG